MILSVDGQNMYRVYTGRICACFTILRGFQRVIKSMFRVMQLAFGFDGEQMD